MKIRIHILAVAFVLVSCVAGAPLVRAGDVIDRIVARVNGSTILMSDWDEELCFEALLDGKPPGQFTEEQRRAALDRLIDQALLRQQLRMVNTGDVSQDAVKKQLAEVRGRHPGTESEAGWNSLLNRYGLTEAEVAGRIARQLSLMQSVDVRLRPSIQVDNASVEAYYKGEFSEKLKKTGSPEVALSEVSGKIRELLTEQKLNDALTTWLQTLRADSQIRTFGPAATSSGGQAQ